MPDDHTATTLVGVYDVVTGTDPFGVGGDALDEDGYTLHGLA